MTAAFNYFLVVMFAYMAIGNTTVIKTLDERVLNLEEHPDLNQLKRELKERMIMREVARDQGISLNESFHDLDHLYSSPKHHGERLYEMRQASQDCIQGDLIFVVDSSGSIGIQHWPEVLNFINGIVDQVGVAPQGTHLGLVTYGNNAHIIFNLINYTDPAPMKAAVSAAKFLNENTNTSGAIKTALDTMFTKENGDREKAPNIMVIITDGVSTYDNATTIPNAVAAKNKGILVVSIGVGNLTSQAELEGMASTGKDGKPTVFTVGSYQALDLVKNQLVHVACNVICCPGTSCSNKCPFGFAPTEDGCLTCECLPQAKTCP